MGEPIKEVIVRILDAAFDLGVHTRKQFVSELGFHAFLVDVPADVLHNIFRNHPELQTTFEGAADKPDKFDLAFENVFDGILKEEDLDDPLAASVVVDAWGVGAVWRFVWQERCWRVGSSDDEEDGRRLLASILIGALVHRPEGADQIFESLGGFEWLVDLPRELRNIVNKGVFRKTFNWHEIADVFIGQLGMLPVVEHGKREPVVVFIDDVLTRSVVDEAKPSDSGTQLDLSSDDDADDDDASADSSDNGDPEVVVECDQSSAPPDGSGGAEATS